MDHADWHDGLLARLCAGRRPPVPSLELEGLLNAVNDDQLSPSELIEGVSESPRLRLTLLTLANGPVWGRHTPARTVVEAVSQLGRRGCTQAAWWLALSELLDAPTSDSELAPPARARDRLWRHLMLTGWLARELARSVCQIPHGDPLLAGFVHDIGHALLASPAARLGVVWHEEHEALADLGDDLAPDRDHGRVGASLLDLWGAPAELVSAALHHHDPREVIPYFQPLVAVVRLADLVAEQVDSTTSPAGWTLRAQPEVEALVAWAGAPNATEVEAVCIASLPEALLQVERWSALRPLRA